MLTVNFILVAVLIIATAFFVAAEFAIVRVRPSRVQQMVLNREKNAMAVKKVTGNLDGYLAACQLGITITAMGLGWLGEPTMERILQPLFIRFDLPGSVVPIISFLAAFLIMTYLHVVFGELAPKTIAIQKAEAITKLLAKPIIWFYKAAYPLIWVLNGSAIWLVRMFGFEPAKEHEEAHSEEELRLILTESYKSGNINQSEFGYVNNIFTFDELHAREIMVPRTDMVCLDINDSVEDNLKIIRRERFSRFPVIDGDKDHIIGILHAKHVFLNYNGQENFDLRKLLQPAMTVLDEIMISDLLKKMQKQNVQLAILLDEYGGTSGMITIEDILEEIVGEIRDEFDQGEKPEIEQLNDSHLIVDGKVPVNSINHILHTDIESEDFDTIGGWLYNRHSALKEGEEWVYNGLAFKILDKEKHRIRKIEVRKLKPSDRSYYDINADRTDEHHLQ